jgi:ATP-dependent Clp protease ATP-binding subunit ClpX
MPPRQVRRTQFADVERGDRGSDTSLHCSFCSKTAGQLEDVIAGPGVAICTDCVALCVEILAEKREAPDHGTPAR